MTSFRFHERVQRLLDDTGTDRQLVRFLFILARGYGHLAAELMEAFYIRNRTLFSKRQQQALERFNEVRAQLEAFPLGQVFHEAIELRRGLDALRKELEAEGGPQGAAFTSGLQADLERFYNAFETFLRSRDDEAFANLLNDAGHLYEHLSAVRRALEGVCRALGHTTPPAPGTERLTLYFEDAPSFTSLAERLGALDTAYREVAPMMSVDPDVEPLELVKVETGGLWICVDGAAGPIGVVGRLVQRYANFLYHRLGTGGGDVPPAERITASQSLINLADELQRAGAPTHPEARTRECAVRLRDAFVRLLEGTSTVHINGGTHGVPEAPQPGVLRASTHVLAAAS